MLLIHPFNKAFGLDIGDLSIKLITLQSKWRYKYGHYFEIEELRSISLPPGYILNGEILQPEMVRKKILKLLDKTPNKKIIKTPWVVANLPESESFLKIIELDIPIDELTDEDVKFQAKKHLPLDLESLYIDWQVIKSKKADNKKTKIILAATKKTNADMYTYLLESVGLTPLALEPEGMAIARAMITAEKDYSGEARMILDLGATRSNLIIYDQDSIQFTQNLNFSGEILTTAIAQELKIEHSKAEKIKIENGLLHNPRYPKYIKVVSETTDKLINEMTKALDFYQGHFESTNQITHITMCGGSSNLKNLDKILTNKLRIESAPGKIWKNLMHPNPNYYSQINCMPYAAATGLALRAVTYFENS